MEICNCECHVANPSVSIMHCFPCCEHCGVEYLNVDYSPVEGVFERLFGKDAIPPTKPIYIDMYPKSKKNV